MGDLPVVPAGTSNTKQDLENAYSSLLNDLSDAYWAAGDLRTKDQIYGCIEAVTNVISHLDEADLESRDSQYTTLVSAVQISRS